MRQEHRVGIPVPDLLGTHVDISVIRIYIDKKLCCIKYLIDRINRVFASYNREESNCIEDKKERACDLEKVAHHEVCCPRGLKFRQAVENIESIKTFLLYNVMDIDSESLESVRQGNRDSLYLRPVFDERFMTCESEIDDISFILYSLLDIRFHEQFELGQIRHTPDDVIAKPDIIECSIHLRDAA